MTSPCWICGSPANSGEHKAKKSDLKDHFGTVTPRTPLYLNDVNNKNRPVKSLKSDLLKWPKFLCQYCNNNRTQPYDMAWQVISNNIHARLTTLRKNNVIRANRIFPYDTRKHMLAVHLYFVKALGCVVRAGIDLGANNIDISGFSKAILQDRCHPDIYIKFGTISLQNNLAMVRASDLNIISDRSSGLCEVAWWFYDVNGLCTLVAFAPNNELFARKECLWHPKYTNSRMIFESF